MSTSIIDGTIEAADLKRARAGIAIFNSIRFRLNDGSTRTVTKAVVAKDVADELKPGATGRFYQFAAFDLKGIHGFRGLDGTSRYKFPANNARLFMIMGIVNALWIVIRLAIDGKIPLLGAGVLVLAVIGYVLMSKGEREAKQQFEADGGYPPPVETPVPAAS